MRPLYVTAAFLIAWAGLAQEVKRPVLSSHDRVDGPFAGEYHVEDLQVFQHGKVVYVSEFADLCGLDRTYVGGIERGERNPAIVNVDAKALKISISLASL